MQDDLCITAQGTDFISIEETLKDALSGLTTYYEVNHLRANPAKTQVCAFHLRNKEAKHQLNVSWCGTPLSHSEHPVYLGVTLDRCLTFKTHITKTKAKVSTRNNILRKPTNTRWGACPKTLCATALVLCFSTAEYACPAWERSTHAKKLDPALNESCRCITGCLKPTNTNNLYILAGIAPPNIRRAVASRTERRRQTTDERHPLHGHVPAPSPLKSRKSFLTSTAPLETTPSEARLAMWKEKLNNHPHSPTMHIPAAESLPPGDNNWAKWKCLNRLRSGVGRSREALSRWGYLSGPTTCDCGTEPQTMEHLLRCPLALYNTKAQQCTNHWLDII
ncbi:hypothetical protein AAFF_G00333780 [Aldrovandia affinis]|uniref:Reverse transcriptase n=1 Tax=Aldrovandia affinis TaxID=143900 RepID=A0AAD7R8Q2_9TELE|nr:hypothetical protein AAFF_G00333780 [Aldrovandia affinis]